MMHFKIMPSLRENISQKFIIFILGVSLIYFFLGNLNKTSSASASLKFEPSSIEAQANQNFSAKIIIDTAGQSVGGAGAKLIYNPTLIAIVSIEPGTPFSDYPTINFDNRSGRAVISGIVPSPDQLFSGKGTFAVVNFQTISSGITEVSFDFEPGSTTDSNIAVTHGNGDVLGEVGELNVNIGEEGGVGEVTPAPVNSEFVSNEVEAPSSFVTKFIEKVKEAFGIKKSTNVDPYKPIPSSSPNQKITRVQPSTQLNQNQSFFASENPLIYILAAFFGITVVLLAYLYIRSRRKKSDSEPPVIIQKDV